jgi:hypothetical protein
MQQSLSTYQCVCSLYVYNDIQQSFARWLVCQPCDEILRTYTMFESERQLQQRYPVWKLSPTQAKRSGFRTCDINMCCYETHRKFPYWLSWWKDGDVPGTILTAKKDVVARIKIEHPAPKRQAKNLQGALGLERPEITDPGAMQNIGLGHHFINPN